MNFCEYGCGKEAKYYFKIVKKWCCSEHYLKCPNKRLKISGSNNPFYGKKHTEENIEKNIRFNKGRKHSLIEKENIRIKILELWKLDKFRIKVLKNIKRRTISMLLSKYPLFSKMEEMRYNPSKLEEKEIQVHCKNHDCPNSKEKGGWFTPSGRQIEARICAIENYSKDNSYFYCSKNCKSSCVLYNLQNDPYEVKEEKICSKADYQTFRQYVLERDNYICQYCGEKATHVHHERPQKLEPFFALDPDYAWSCCKKCHYEKGHQTGTECSLDSIREKVCRG